MGIAGWKEMYSNSDQAGISAHALFTGFEQETGARKNFWQISSRTQLLQSNISLFVSAGPLVKQARSDCLKEMATYLDSTTIGLDFGFQGFH